jgi:hypothetical protein
MFSRALEAVCTHKLLTKEDRAASKQRTLAVGIKELFDKKIIDARLFDWSEHLRAFRNLAAHASDKQISRNEAEDPRAFVYAIIEYIFDLTECYEEFKNRKLKPPYTTWMMKFLFNSLREHISHHLTCQIPSTTRTASFITTSLRHRSPPARASATSARAPAG